MNPIENYCRTKWPSVGGLSNGESSILIEHDLMNRNNSFREADISDFIGDSIFDSFFRINKSHLQEKSVDVI